MRMILPLILSAFAALFPAVGPVSSNGFQHYAYWNPADSCLYHVSVSGAARDTHLVKRYQARFRSRDTLVNVGTADVWKDTVIAPDFYNYQWIRIAHDTVVISDTLPSYSPAVVISDTFVQVHLGKALSSNPANAGTDPLVSVQKYDYLVVNGQRVKVHRTFRENGYADVRPVVWVDKNVPTGAGLSLNATFRTLPSLKTLSSDQGYSLLADPVFPNKLYVFYISDSSRVVCQVSWDNGLSWEEWRKARDNAVLSSPAGARSNLSASISGSGLITLSWTGSGSGATLQAPASVDTAILYVRPVGDTNPDVNNTGKSLNSPFNSIDRALTQIIMDETGLGRATVLNNEWGAANRDTAMSRLRPEATRAYVIKMLPGEYMDVWADGRISGGSTILNRVSFPDWDHSLTIESYYSNVDSFVVLNGTNYGVFRFNTSEGLSGWNGAYVAKYPLYGGHVVFNRLKVTSAHHSKEAPFFPALINVGSDIPSLSNIRITGNLIFSVDSSNLSVYGVRSFGCVFYSGSGSAMDVDNVFIAGNIFHRINSFNAYALNGSRYDYGMGFYFSNNTHYKQKSAYWTEHSLNAKVSMVNTLLTGSPSPFDPGQFVAKDFIGRCSSGVSIYKTVDNNPYLDTVPGTEGFMRIGLSFSELRQGKSVNLLDSLVPADFYGMARQGVPYIGACKPLDYPVYHYSGLGLTLDVTASSAVSATISVDTLKSGVPNYMINEIIMDTVGLYLEAMSYNFSVSENLEAVMLGARFAVGYSELDLSGIKESTLALFSLDSTGWKRISGQLDMTAKTLSADLAHFSIYGIFGEALTTPDEEATVSVLETTLEVFPNPFNPVAHVGLSLKEPGRASLTVYNMAGQAVRTLAHGLYGAGRHELSWDGRDNQGAALPSGIYIMRMRTKGLELTRRVQLMK